MDKAEKNRLLSGLPSVDEVLKNPDGQGWLSLFQRTIVVQAVREVIASRRKDILEGSATDLSPAGITSDIRNKIASLSSFSLLPLINATGIVIHTNLGRAVLSDKVLSHVSAVSGSYSNLEYDLAAGKRGRRHTHTKRLLTDITGAEDALIVNNNAAAVLLCLSTMARGREVIVSRSELVEIGGSFRVPDVMAAGGAVLREVGTTNKTHLYDYENAINDNTALILKVHQSNYKIVGFAEGVPIEDLVSLSRKHQVPVMYDLGSGCLIDLRPYGIHDEPSVSGIVRSGVDIVTFSGDKLLGGPQGGIIVGQKRYVEKIQKNPLARAVRIDKMAIAAFEATLREYSDIENAKKEIPVLNMLLQTPEEIRARAKKIAAALQKEAGNADFAIFRDASKAGGGSLPEVEFPTYAVSIKPAHISVNELELRLRRSTPPVIARIKDDSLTLDARTIRKKDIDDLVRVVASCLSSE
ncbi:selenocysteine synthase [Candidatus Sulfobium mesophilum]|uniref:L-seryl-tRNA(Sec) selenium transferase n=1 Tax=Candidatus Sulfobium mesophilum TaxID=2016548 RepID=A0A2U3QHB5_9BACT|nr:selenocysteine synthase [Candidatus Sulfobium mesophilum]